MEFGIKAVHCLVIESLRLQIELVPSFLAVVIGIQEDLVVFAVVADRWFVQVANCFHKQSP